MKPTIRSWVVFRALALSVLIACTGGISGGWAQSTDNKLEILATAASAGDVTAQYLLGFLYYKGIDVQQDYAKAAQWFRKAAEKGDPEAQSILGHMYAEGRGLPRDYVQSMTWFRRAVQQGNASAQFELAVMYAKGRGVPQDMVQAAKWYLRAAEQGHEQSQLALGFLYLEGLGMPQDFVMAHQWFNLAASALKGEEREKALSARDGLTKRMSPDQTAEAQRMARTWMQKKLGKKE